MPETADTSAGGGAGGGAAVQLYLYDLSAGLARMLSQQLTGTHIEGVWHTSIVLYGKEVYFGQGIEVQEPGSVPHGHLVQVIPMGTTGIPEDVFWEYIDSLRDVWTADKYHLFNNNCNSFTRPLGRQLAPVLEGMFGPARVAAEHRDQIEPSALAAALAGAVAPPSQAVAPAAAASASLPTMPPTVFAQSSNPGAIAAKLRSFLAASDVTLPRPAVVDDVVRSVAAALIPPPEDLWEFVDLCVSGLPPYRLFPLLDLLRLLVLNRHVADAIVRDSPSHIMAILYRLGPGADPAGSAALPATARLMLLRLACNLFSRPDLAGHATSLHLSVSPATATATTATARDGERAATAANTAVPHRTVLTALLVDARLAQHDADAAAAPPADPRLRAAAAGLALNVAGLLRQAAPAPASLDPVADDWAAEVFAAAATAVQSCRGDADALRLLLTALRHLLELRSDAVSALADALDVRAAVAAAAASSLDDNGRDADGVAKLAREVDSLLRREGA